MDVSAQLLTVQFLPVANSTYCTLKNASGSISHDGSVICVDSDFVPEPG